MRCYIHVGHPALILRTEAIRALEVISRCHVHRSVELAGQDGYLLLAVCAFACAIRKLGRKVVVCCHVRVEAQDGGCRHILRVQVDASRQRPVAHSFNSSPVGSSGGGSPILAFTRCQRLLRLRGVKLSWKSEFHALAICCQEPPAFFSSKSMWSSAEASAQLFGIAAVRLGTRLRGVCGLDAGVQAMKVSSPEEGVEGVEDTPREDLVGVVFCFLPGLPSMKATSAARLRGVEGEGDGARMGAGGGGGGGGR